MSKATRELLWYLETYAALTGGALLVLLLLYLFGPGLRRRWLPLRRLRPITWTGYEVLLAFCALKGFPIFIISILLQMGFFQALIGPEPAGAHPNLPFTIYINRCQIISGPLIFTVTLAFLFTMMYARRNTQPPQYGLTWARVLPNFALGLLAFLAATPVVLGIQAVAILVLPQRPHALEVLGNQSLEAWEWVLFALQPILMAPLLEEIIFRGILQGWLRRATLLGHIILIAVTLQSAAGSVYYYDFAENDSFVDIGPLVFGGLMVGGYIVTLVWMTRRFHMEDVEIQRWRLRSEDEPLEELTPAEEELQELCASRWKGANALLAICGSAMLFAVGHSDAWPAPLALLPMGLVLGWLSYRTQSLIAPITFHAVFNLMSLIVLYRS